MYCIKECFRVSDTSTSRAQVVRFAVPIWNDRVSPVFDTARRLVLVDIRQGKEQERQVVEIEADSFPARRARRLVELRVNVLVCGAISRPLAELVTMAGVMIVPWVTGQVDDVLRAYMAGRLGDSRWRMPGCRRNQTEPGAGGAHHGNSQDG